MPAMCRHAVALTRGDNFAPPRATISRAAALGRSVTSIFVVAGVQVIAAYRSAPQFESLERDLGAAPGRLEDCQMKDFLGMTNEEEASVNLQSAVTPRSFL
jgi:hypothetical protein